MSVDGDAAEASQASYSDQPTAAIPVTSTQLKLYGDFRSTCCKLARTLNHSHSLQWCGKLTLTLCLQPAAKRRASLMLCGTFYTPGKEQNPTHLKDWAHFQLSGRGVTPLCDITKGQLLKWMDFSPKKDNYCEKALVKDKMHNMAT